MSVFLTTLNQIAFLFGFIVIGFILVKIKVLPENSAAVLSKLENTIFIPALFVSVASFFKIPEKTYICALCSLAMPLGLNTIVIPSAFGKDTTVAAGMAVISHLLSCITITLIFCLCIR